MPRIVQMAFETPALRIIVGILPRSTSFLVSSFLGRNDSRRPCLRLPLPSVRGNSDLALPCSRTAHVPEYIDPSGLSWAKTVTGSSCLPPHAVPGVLFGLSSVP